MDLLLLGGNSLGNRAWIYTVEKAFASLFDAAWVQEYRHWHTGEKLIDLTLESTVLTKQAKTHARYAVFAKSAGALTTLKAIAEDGLAPRMCVFVGTAIGFAREMDLPVEEWLKHLDMPTLFIHNTHDPLIDAQALTKLVAEAGCNYCSFALLEGDTHDYLDMEFLKTEVGRFMRDLPNTS